MKVSLVTEGLFKPSELSAWTRERQEQINRGVADGFKEGGEAIVPELRADLERGLKVKKRGLAKSVRAKVYSNVQGRMPVLYLGSVVPWLGIHERGGVVQGPLLIPLLDTRIGYQKFKQIVAMIVRTGAGFFKRMDDGRVILFAEYQPDYGRPLARFRRAERARRQGPVRRGEDIPIAVLVSQVTLRKRLHFEQITKARLGVIVEAIERSIEKRGGRG